MWILPSKLLIFVAPVRKVFDPWWLTLSLSQSACCMVEIQAPVMELFLPPYKLSRERSRRLHRSECRERSRGTNAAVIRVSCVTSW